jgi:serine/threonine protein kinase
VTSIASARTSATTTARSGGRGRLGAGLVEIPPVPFRDPADAVLLCDFKPDNVIQTHDSLKLIDLGGVYRLDDPTASVFGTPGYEGPEIQVTGPSIPSDLFAVARTLAVLCTDFPGQQSTYRFTLPPRESVVASDPQDWRVGWSLAAYAPESSSGYLDAQTAQIRCLVSRNGTDPTFDALLAAAPILEALPLEGEARDRLTAELLETALALARRGQAQDDHRTEGAGHRLSERELRLGLGLERSYRTLARHATSRGERLRLVDEVNRTRPRTWT